MAPTATFMSLEAKTILTAVEKLITELTKTAATSAPGTGGSLAESASTIAKELESGAYPHTVMFISFHQREYARASEIVGLLLIAATRARRDTHDTVLQ